jgi:glucose-6-phosphate isomerase
LQEGRRTILETFLTIDSLPKYLSQMNQSVTNTTLAKLNEQAWKATMAAHSDGGLPCLSLRMRDTSLFALGYLYYFMMKACAMSAYLLGVNPFNQPGVEKYKSYMRATK